MPEYGIPDTIIGPRAVKVAFTGEQGRFHGNFPQPQELQYSDGIPFYEVSDLDTIDHFPQFSIMPGYRALQLAEATRGGQFTSISNVKFLRMVRPDDKLEIHDNDTSMEIVRVIDEKDPQSVVSFDIDTTSAQKTEGAITIAEALELSGQTLTAFMYNTLISAEGLYPLIHGCDCIELSEDPSFSGELIIEVQEFLPGQKQVEFSGTIEVKDLSGKLIATVRNLQMSLKGIQQVKMLNKIGRF